jgi:methylated-DNA-[protein]-cysteine S-methyltransferase
VATERVQFTYLRSPIGRLLIAGDRSGLRRIQFPTEQDRKPPRDWIEGGALLAPALEQLQAYFAGRLQKFDVRLAPEGTRFQLEVWSQLRKIPYGRTISYGELARRIGKPSAARAVGAANGQNPLPIVVPCHRVIGANGALVGFGGGLELKAKLLDLERRFGGAPKTQPDLWASASAV